MLRDSQKLRRMIVFRLNEEGKTKVLTELGIDRRNFNRYVKGDKILGQRDIIRICDRLNIKIKFDVEM
jgi:hypothetical protein